MLKNKCIFLHFIILLLFNKCFCDQKHLLNNPLYAKQKKDFLESFHQEIDLFSYDFIYDDRNEFRNPKTVYLRGTFNSDLGQLYSNITLDEIKPGVFKKTLNLPEGIYRYTIKLNLGEKVSSVFNFRHTDPSLKGSNEYNTSNIFYAGPPVPIKKGIQNFLGHIPLNSYSDLKTIHNPNNSFDRSFLSPSLTRLMCRLSTGSASKVFVWFRTPNRQKSWNYVPMTLTTSFSQWDFFCVTLDNLSKDDLEYFFQITDGITHVYLGDNTYSNSKLDIEKKPFIFPLINTRGDNTWACDAIWYQIFLDRFKNGFIENDPPNTVKGQDWPDDTELKKAHERYGWSYHTDDISDYRRYSQKAIQEANRHQEISYSYKQTINNLRFGGDLQGLIESIPYLQELGINAVYLTPIFMGKTAHHYHVLDLRHVDDVFGIPHSFSKISDETIDPATWQWTESDLLLLDVIQKLHDQNIKIVLDIGLHSIHREHEWFQDVVKKHQNSAYFSWFDSHKWGLAPNEINYWTWDRWTGGSEMPLFGIQENLNYPDDLRYFLLSVVKRWLCPNGDPKAGVDGFRIDSPESLPIFFLMDLRHLVNTFKPEAILINENWHRTSTTNISKIFDANADMEWTEQLHHYFVANKKMLPEYLEYVQELFSFGCPQTVMSSWHAIGNHDTIRFAGSLENPEAGLHPYVYPYYEIQKPKESSWQRFQQVITYQFTSFGAPYIYYGDEVGMWSGSDPFNRQPMAWEHINTQIWNFYRKLIAIRKKCIALNRGNFTLLDLDEEVGVFGFKRTVENEELWVLFNRSATEKSISITIGQEFNGEALIDYLNPNHVDWIEDNQKGLIPYIKDPNSQYLVKEGEILLSIQPWESMILIKKNAFLKQLEQGTFDDQQ